MCNCRTCERGRKIQSVIESRNVDALIETLTEVWDLMEYAEEDRDWYKVMQVPDLKEEIKQLKEQLHDLKRSDTHPG